jgi:Fur family transcriptional regulator, ferric uptake regulator
VWIRAGAPIGRRWGSRVTKVPTHPDRAGNVDTIEAAVVVLRADGKRLTKSRLMLLHALFDAPRNRTAEELAAEIHAQRPSINVSTVYRNLDELERLGVVLHAHLAHGPGTYHLAALAHGHFVCEECGGVTAAPTEVFTALARTAESRFGFQIHPYHFAVPGRCEACRNA